MGQKDRFKDRIKQEGRKPRNKNQRKEFQRRGPGTRRKGQGNRRERPRGEGSEGRREPREGAIPRKVCSLLRRGRMALSRARPAIMDGRTPTVTSAVSRPGLSLATPLCGKCVYVALDANNILVSFSCL